MGLHLASEAKTNLNQFVKLSVNSLNTTTIKVQCFTALVLNSESEIVNTIDHIK